MVDTNVENKIWVTSDLHFCHDRGFLYEPRGFTNVEDMNNAIVQNWNCVVNPQDTIYVLGDIMLNDNKKGIKLLKSLKGHIHIILGNHDTVVREELYKECPNVEEVALAARIKYKGYHFFMTHFPCFTANFEQKSLKQYICNLYGHTHQKTNFYQDIPFMYHVGVDSHDCAPVCLDDIIEEMRAKAQELL